MSGDQFLAEFGAGASDERNVPVVPIAHPIFRGNQTPGKKATLTATNPKQTIVRLLSIAEAPELIGVQIDVKIDEDTPNETVTCRVQWGNDAVHEALIDATRGAAFAVVATSLLVTVELDIGSGPVEVSATTGPGAPGGNGPGPTRTTRTLTAVAPTAVDVEQIPKYAKAVRIYRIPVSQPITVRQLGSSPTESVVPAFAESPDFVIANGNYRLQITNDGAVDITAIIRVYQLAVGGA